MTQARREEEGLSAETFYKYNFDESNDRIEVAHYSDLNVGTGAYTFHFWLKVITPSSVSTAFEFLLYTNNSNFIRVLFYNDASSRIIEVSSVLAGAAIYPIYVNKGIGNLPHTLQGVWTHYAFVRHATTGEHRFWANGIRYTSADSGYGQFDNRNLSFNPYFVTGVFYKKAAELNKFRFINGEALWWDSDFDPNTIDYSLHEEKGLYLTGRKPSNWNTDLGSSTFQAENLVATKPQGIIYGRTTGDISNFYV